MTNERYAELMKNMDAVLTDEEIKEGFHFCDDYDGLLVGPTSPEVQNCTCGE